MSIDGIGEALAEQLVAKGLVSDVSDLYRLRTDQLLALERFGERSARRLLGEIAASRERGLARLLNGLGIPLVGEHVAQILAGRFGTLARLARASEATLAETAGVGPRIAASVAAFFAEPRNRRLVARLAQAGVSGREARQAVSSGPLAGKTVVLTGALSTLTRDAAAERVRQAGGAVREAVSRSTDFVVVGADPGRKLAEASRLGVPLLDERALLRLTRRRAR
jgi:DNA ligase (NAD+)